jgi:hypothetical protein
VTVHSTAFVRQGLKELNSNWARGDTHLSATSGLVEGLEHSRQHGSDVLRQDAASGGGDGEGPSQRSGEIVCGEVIVAITVLRS